MRRLALVLAPVLALWLALPGVAEERANPHHDAAACSTCHTEAAGDTVGAARLDVKLCRDCHPTADMHTVEIPPGSVTIAEGWPLHDGKLVCSTCHANPSCEADRMQEAPYWRGGPAMRIQDFCYRCHERSEYQRTDPHHGPEPTGCAACHLPDGESLRLPADKMCAECHRDEGHLGLDTHMGKSPEGEIAPELHLLDGKIACVTCHDVHMGAEDKMAEARKQTIDQGFGTALRARSAASDWAGMVPDGVAWPGDARGEAHPALLALPIHDGSLCSGCHWSGR